MQGLVYTHDDFDAFEKLCEPSNISERMRKASPPQTLAEGLSQGVGNAFSLKDLFSFPKPEDRARKIAEALEGLLSEVQVNRYHKWLMSQMDYRNACDGFERKLRKKDENEKRKSRLMFAYVSGRSVYYGKIVKKPTRLMPSKRAAERILNHLDGLLSEINRKDEFALWADYGLNQQLVKLKRKLEESKDVPKVKHSMSPEHFFVFRTAQIFQVAFDEPMPGILGDLCRVLGYAPDDSTINRWVAEAESHTAKQGESS